MARRYRIILLAMLVALAGFLIGRAAGAPRSAADLASDSAPLPAEPARRDIPPLPAPPKQEPPAQAALQEEPAGGGVPAGLGPTDEGQLVIKAYFVKSSAASSGDCSAVGAVQRRIPAGSQVYREAIQQLLAGPTEQERTSGYQSMFAAGTSLKSVAADGDGVVTADFTTELLRGMAGDCRSAGLKAQLIATLRQFPEVHAVEALASGKSAFTGQ